jgi:hypothetical protein
MAAYIDLERALRTTVDDLATALEEAERFGDARAAAVLRGVT